MHKKTTFLLKIINNSYRQLGFSFVKLIIATGIIAVLAIIIIIIINSEQKIVQNNDFDREENILFAQNRDFTREEHIQSIRQAVSLYQKNNNGDLPEGIETKPKEICKIEINDCDKQLVDLSELVSEYISVIPTDPQGGIHPQGTGYFIRKEFINISAPKAETKEIYLGICPPAFTDKRDGNIYTAVQIGSQCWMAENLNYDNGCTQIMWENKSDEEWCGYYKHNGELLKENGLLYQWSAAMNGFTKEGTQGICPEGWHLPTDIEFHDLENHFASETCNSERIDIWDSSFGCKPAGIKLKTETGNGDNESGFNALLVGNRGIRGFFYFLNKNTVFWSSTEKDDDNAWRRFLDLDRTGVLRSFANKAHAFPVRCLKN